MATVFVGHGSDKYRGNPICHKSGIRVFAVIVVDNEMLP